MAFSVIIPKKPTSIGVFSIGLYDGDGTNSERTVQYDVEVLDQDGNTYDGKTGNLANHLDPADVAWLLDFSARMRTKAENEILPTEVLP